MKMSAIERMFYGENGRKEYFKKTDKYAKKLENVVNSEQKIIEKLNNLPELKKLFETHLKNVEDLFGESESVAYVDGFKFGFLIAHDIFTDS